MVTYVLPLVVNHIWLIFLLLFLYTQSGYFTFHTEDIRRKEEQSEVEHSTELDVADEQSEVEHTIVVDVADEQSGDNIQQKMDKLVDHADTMGTIEVMIAENHARAVNEPVVGNIVGDIIGNVGVDTCVTPVVAGMIDDREAISSGDDSGADPTFVPPAVRVPIACTTGGKARAPGGGKARVSGGKARAPVATMAARAPVATMAARTPVATHVPGGESSAPAPVVTMASSAVIIRDAHDMTLDLRIVPSERIALGTRVPVEGRSSLVFFGMQFRWATSLYTDVSLCPNSDVVDANLRENIVTARKMVHDNPEMYELVFQRNFHIYAFQCLEFG